MHKEKYKKIAEQFGLPVEMVKKICESQFEFTKEMIQSGDDLPIRLQYIGKFEVKPGRRETVRKKREIMYQNYEKSRRGKE